MSICIAYSRLDAMKIAWGGVSGCVNPVYSCMLQLTCSLHRRGLILQNKESARLWHRTYIFISSRSPYGQMWCVLMIFLWQTEMEEEWIALMDWKIYMGDETAWEMRGCKVTTLKVNSKALLWLIINCLKSRGSITVQHSPWCAEASPLVSGSFSGMGRRQLAQAAQGTKPFCILNHTWTRGHFTFWITLGCTESVALVYTF